MNCDFYKAGGENWPISSSYSKKEELCDQIYNPASVQFSSSGAGTSSERSLGNYDFCLRQNTAPFSLCQGCRRFETSVFFSVKINISTTGGFRVGFFLLDTNYP